MGNRVILYVNDSSRREVAEKLVSTLQDRAAHLQVLTVDNPVALDEAIRQEPLPGFSELLWLMGEFDTYERMEGVYAPRFRNNCGDYFAVIVETNSPSDFAISLEEHQDVQALHVRYVQGGFKKLKDRTGIALYYPSMVQVESADELKADFKTLNLQDASLDATVNTLRKVFIPYVQQKLSSVSPTTGRGNSTANLLERSQIEEQWQPLYEGARVTPFHL